jgi:hypothetical protein
LRATFLAPAFLVAVFLTVFFAADFLTVALLLAAFFNGLFLAAALRAVFLTAPFLVAFFAALFLAAAFLVGFLAVAFTMFNFPSANLASSFDMPTKGLHRVSLLISHARGVASLALLMIANNLSPMRSLMLSAAFNVIPMIVVCAAAITVLTKPEAIAIWMPR